MTRRNKKTGQLPATGCDHGSRWRAQHEGGLGAIEVRERTNGGTVLATGRSVRVECLLDKLHLQGTLGRGETALARYQAGLALRAEYYALHESAPISAYKPRTERVADQLFQDMTDRQAWNLRAYNSVIQALGFYGPLLEAVCCRDEPRARHLLLEGLDRLVDLQEMRRPTVRRTLTPELRAEIERVIRDPATRRQLLGGPEPPGQSVPERRHRRAVGLKDT